MLSSVDLGTALTHADTLTTLGTTAEEMTAPWIMVATPPTQVLAQAAYDSGRVAGIRHSSAKHRGKKNLMVYTERLQSAPGDLLEVHDPDGHLTQRIGACPNACKPRWDATSDVNSWEPFCIQDRSSVHLRSANTWGARPPRASRLAPSPDGTIAC